LTKCKGAFQNFAPQLYTFYKRKMAVLIEKDETLKMPFLESVFACIALNFSPKVVVVPHRDNLNLTYGWCAITALGDVEHTIGGHMVLPDLKLAIKFLAGSSIFIQSAIFTHYNLLIGLGETRQSITQFSAGGLFRWISYRHQLEEKATAKSVHGETW